MALVLSGSIDISGSMTATTIVVSAPGVAGMVSSSAQIRELAPLMAYTASLKGAAIVSSSQQIQNYNTFAVTSSANTFYGSQTITGNINIRSGNGVVFYRPDNGIYTELYDSGSGTSNGFVLNNTNGEGFHFKNAAATIMRLGSNNNVGIKTTTPDTTLHISGSDGIKIQAGGNADTPGLTIINYTNQYGWAKFAGGLQGNGNGYATISCWNGASVSEKVRVSGDGYLRLAGTGIQFNGDTAEANSLDDYEEGTWTPTITFGGGAAGLTYNTQYGVYTKIGNVVHFSFRLILSAKGSSTGGAVMAGLPFTSANTNGNFGAVPVAFADAVSSFDKTLTWIVDPNATTIALRYCNGTNYADLNDTNFTNSSNIIASGTYRTA